MPETIDTIVLQFVTEGEEKALQALQRMGVAIGKTIKANADASIALNKTSTSAFGASAGFKALQNEVSRLSGGLQRASKTIMTGNVALDLMAMRLDRASMMMWKFAISAIPLRELAQLAGMAAMGIGGVGYAAISTAAKIDAAKRSFTAITGSAEEANKAVNYLVAQAPKIRYTMDQVVSAGRILTVAGYDIHKLIYPMADLAAGIDQAGITIEHAARAFVDAMHGEFRRLRNTFDISRDEVEKWAAGAIDSQGRVVDKTKLQYGILMAITEKYGGANEAVMKGLPGVWSNFIDALRKLGVAFGQWLLPDTIRFLRALTVLTEKLSAVGQIPLIGWLTKFVFWIGAIGTGAVAAAAKLGQIYISLKGLQAAIGTFRHSMGVEATKMWEAEYQMLMATQKIAEIEARRSQHILPLITAQLMEQQAILERQEAMLALRQAQLTGGDVKGATERLRQVQKQYDIAHRAALGFSAQKRQAELMSDIAQLIEERDELLDQRDKGKTKGISESIRKVKARLHARQKEIDVLDEVIAANADAMEAVAGKGMINIAAVSKAKVSRSIVTQVLDDMEDEVSNTHKVVETAKSSMGAVSIASREVHRSMRRSAKHFDTISSDLVNKFKIPDLGMAMKELVGAVESRKRSLIRTAEEYRLQEALAPTTLLQQEMREMRMGLRRPYLGLQMSMQAAEHAEVELANIIQHDARIVASQVSKAKDNVRKLTAISRAQDRVAEALLRRAYLEDAAARQAFEEGRDREALAHHVRAYKNRLMAAQKQYQSAVIGEMLAQSPKRRAPERAVRYFAERFDIREDVSRLGISWAEGAWKRGEEARLEAVAARKMGHLEYAEKLGRRSRYESLHMRAAMHAYKELAENAREMALATGREVALTKGDMRRIEEIAQRRTVIARLLEQRGEQEEILARKAFREGKESDTMTHLLNSYRNKLRASMMLEEARRTADIGRADFREAFRGGPLDRAIGALSRGAATSREFLRGAIGRGVGGVRSLFAPSERMLKYFSDKMYEDVTTQMEAYTARVRENARVMFMGAAKAIERSRVNIALAPSTLARRDEEAVLKSHKQALMFNKAKLEALEKVQEDLVAFYDEEARIVGREVVASRGNYNRLARISRQREQMAEQLSRRAAQEESLALQATREGKERQALYHMMNSYRAELRAAYLRTQARRVMEIGKEDFRAARGGRQLTSEFLGRFDVSGAVRERMEAIKAAQQEIARDALKGGEQALAEVASAQTEAARRRGIAYFEGSKKIYENARLKERAIDKAYSEIEDQLNTETRMLAERVARTGGSRWRMNRIARQEERVADALIKRAGAEEKTAFEAAKAGNERKAFDRLVNAQKMRILAEYKREQAAVVRGMGVAEIRGAYEGGPRRGILGVTRERVSSLLNITSARETVRTAFSSLGQTVSGSVRSLGGTVRNTANTFMKSLVGEESIFARRRPSITPEFLGRFDVSKEVGEQIDSIRATQRVALRESIRVGAEALSEIAGAQTPEERMRGLGYYEGGRQSFEYARLKTKAIEKAYSEIEGQLRTESQLLAERVARTGGSRWRMNRIARHEERIAASLIKRAGAEEKVVFEAVKAGKEQEALSSLVSAQRMRIMAEHRRAQAATIRGMGVEEVRGAYQVVARRGLGISLKESITSAGATVQSSFEKLGTTINKNALSFGNVVRNTANVVSNNISRSIVSIGKAARTGAASASGFIVGAVDKIKGVLGLFSGVGQSLLVGSVLSAAFYALNKVLNSTAEAAQRTIDRFDALKESLGKLGEMGYEPSPLAAAAVKEGEKIKTVLSTLQAGTPWYNRAISWVAMNLSPFTPWERNRRIGGGPMSLMEAMERAGIPRAEQREIGMKMMQGVKEARLMSPGAYFFTPIWLAYRMRWVGLRAASQAALIRGSVEEELREREVPGALPKYLALYSALKNITNTPIHKNFNKEFVRFVIIGDYWEKLIEKQGENILNMRIPTSVIEAGVSKYLENINEFISREQDKALQRGRSRKLPGIEPIAWEQAVAEYSKATGTPFEELAEKMPKGALGLELLATAFRELSTQRENEADSIDQYIEKSKKEGKTTSELSGEYDKKAKLLGEASLFQKIAAGITMSTTDANKYYELSEKGNNAVLEKKIGYLVDANNEMSKYLDIMGSLGGNTDLLVGTNLKLADSLDELANSYEQLGKKEEAHKTRVEANQKRTQAFNSYIESSVRVFGDLEEAMGQEEDLPGFEAAGRERLRWMEEAHLQKIKQHRAILEKARPEDREWLAPLFAAEERTSELNLRRARREFRATPFDWRAREYESKAAYYEVFNNRKLAYRMRMVGLQAASQAALIRGSKAGIWGAAENLLSAQKEYQVGQAQQKVDMAEINAQLAEQRGSYIESDRWEKIRINNMRALANVHRAWGNELEANKLELDALKAEAELALRPIDRLMKLQESRLGFYRARGVAVQDEVRLLRESANLEMARARERAKALLAAGQDPSMDPEVIDSYTRALEKENEAREKSRNYAVELYNVSRMMYEQGIIGEDLLEERRQKAIQTLREQINTSVEGSEQQLQAWREYLDLLNDSSNVIDRTIEKIIGAPQELLNIVSKADVAKRMERAAELIGTGTAQQAGTILGRYQDHAIIELRWPSKAPRGLEDAIDKGINAFITTFINSLGA